MHGNFLQRCAIKKIEQTWKRVEKRKFFKKIEQILIKDQKNIVLIKNQNIFFIKSQILLGMKRNLEYFFLHFPKFS